MLQQTQVDRVLPKYHEWLERFPSLADLAARPVEEAVEAWYPLGYNIRPRRLHSIAREAVARYGGTLPSDEATLLSFKGIGRYTAGAIRSFAFGERSAILDTNVARVLFRVFVGKGDSKAHAMRAHLWTIAHAVLPRKRVFDFNQALMDFGALVCPARKPHCPVCPMARGCQSYPLDGSPRSRRPRQAPAEGGRWSSPPRSSSARAGCSSRSGSKARTWEGAGSSRAASASRENRPGRACCAS